MPRISRYPLDKIIETEMFRQFWESISRLKNASEVSAFFSDLLSDTEEVMLAKRFAVAVLLLRGKRPSDISSSLHVSFTSIGSVASWLKNAKPRTQRLLQEMTQSKDWRQLLDRIEELLDKFPPRYGTNWQNIGDEKEQRRIERAARRALR